MRFVLDLGYNLLNHFEYNFNKIDYVLITHEHQDHIKYLETFFNIHKSRLIIPKKIETWLFEKCENLKKKLQLNLIENEKWLHRFKIEHDSIDNEAYIVDINSFINFAYLTDAKEIPNSFKEKIINLKIKNIFIEANYDNDLIFDKDKNIFKDARTVLNHLSLQQTFNFLNEIKDYFNEKINVILVHKSKTNANEKSFEIFNSLKEYFNIYVAEKGLELMLW